ncbi:hypothetical protein KF840_23890 [bacterium]|nr:hypothetical protein [bacterium]
MGREKAAPPGKGALPGVLGFTGGRSRRGKSVMDVNLLAGALAGLVLSALLVTSRAECADFLLAPVSERDRWAPPVSGFVTGTGLFIAVASLWLLRALV